MIAEAGRAIRRKTAAVAGAAAFALAGVAWAGANANGGAGVGDPYYPDMGNTGYDAKSYDFKLSYEASGQAESKTTMLATALTSGLEPNPGNPLASFHLDYRGPKVTSIRVEGAPADFERDGQELIVTPAAPLPNAEDFTTVVRYEGKPKQVLNQDGSRDGWTKTGDGVVALGEPQAVPSFAPVSDHPTDKATWTIDLDVSRKLTGISNGVLVSKDKTKKRTRTSWEQAEPMASYLLMVTIGKYRLDRGAFDGHEYFSAVDKSLPKSVVGDLRRKTRDAHDFLETIAGEYPFEAIGGVVDPSSLGFALENQSRSYYPGQPGERLVVHETAHQWFGDSVSVDRWKEIWLNEGWATYMEWLYEENQGAESAADRLDRLYDEHPAGDNGFWNPPPADPGGPAQLFAGSVYIRGAMALQVLREEIGDPDFFEVLSRWASENANANNDTAGLYELIEDVTGSSRPQSFDDWLYDTGKPALP